MQYKLWKRSSLFGGVSLGSGTSFVPYSVNAINLLSNTTYYYCAMAYKQGTGWVPGNVRTLITSGATQRLCTSYFGTPSQAAMVQGSWTDSSTAIASKDACSTWGQDNLLTKPYCAQAFPAYVGGPTDPSSSANVLKLLYIDRAKVTYNLPSVTASELVFDASCSSTGGSINP